MNVGFRVDLTLNCPKKRRRHTPRTVGSCRRCAIKDAFTPREWQNVWRRDEGR